MKRRKFTVEEKIKTAEAILEGRLTPQEARDKKGNPVGSLLARRWVNDYEHGRFDKVLDHSRARIRASNLLGYKSVTIPPKPKTVYKEIDLKKLDNEIIQMLKVRLADTIIREQELMIENEVLKRQLRAAGSTLREGAELSV